MRFKVVIMIAIAGLAFLSFINGTFKPATGLKIGDKVPSIESDLLDGTSFNLDSLKGKMVLIDFWASYDAPSRINNFRKKIILDQYKNSGFVNAQGLVIINVSLDRFKSPLKQSIKRDELEEFLHLCDFKGRESDLVSLFSVKDEMPNFLIDGEGRIVASSHQLEKIETTLERLEKLDPSRLANNRKTN